MKKLALIILVFLLIIFFCPPAASAETEYKLKYDFQYLFEWVAKKMEIAIDPQKPVPTLKIVLQEELLPLYEQKNGKLKMEIEENGKIKKFNLAGFYQHQETAVYVKDKVNKGETLEEIIVHELIHYFQHLYPTFFSQDFTCLQDSFPYKGCPRQREACRMEKLFRWEHGLKIIDSDLECLNP